MATNATWTVVFDDKIIIKQSRSMLQVLILLMMILFGVQAKYSNIWAIHYGNAVASDEVEYRDDTPHSSYADANLGDISQFSSRWDTMYLAKIQTDWDNNLLFDDNNEVVSETEAEKNC